MLENLLKQFCKELDIQIPKSEEKNLYTLDLSDDIELILQDLDPGVSFQSKISKCPKEKREDLFIYLMKANLLGQGTGGSVIGLDHEEKFLTLSLAMPYEMNYRVFKDHLEDFVNFLAYWREEIESYQKKVSENLL